MQIRIFSISNSSTADEQEELNKFLRSHRIIEVRQQYDETRGLWTFAVSYIENADVASSSQPSADKVDYRAVLSPEIFSIYSRLREARKKIAKDENVPVYAVFSNKELSMIAALPDLSINEMMKINGINRMRAEKYGIAILQVLAEMPEQTNETTGMGD